MRKFILLLIVIIIPSIGYAGEIKLSDFSVHLLLERSGSLSGDITSSPEFMAWNFSPIDPGIDDSETFHDFLVKIKFTSSKASYESGNVAKLQISKKQDGTIIFSKDLNGIYIGPEKIIYKGVWVSNHVCDLLVVTVSDGNKSISKELQFGCGE